MENSIVTKINKCFHLYWKNEIFHIRKLQEFARQPNLQDFEDYVQGFEITDKPVSAFRYIS